MKKTNWKGRFFSLLLAFVLLLPTILSTSVKAAPENDKNDGQIKHVTEISFTIYNYAIGNDANSIQVNCQTDGVRPTNYELLVYDKNEDEFVPVKGKLQADIQYRLKINFSPKDGYDFEGLTKEKIKLGAIGSAIRYRENKKEALFDMPTLTVTPEFKTLKFETNGGSTINSVTKTQDSTIELDQYKPTKDGFIFDGWYKDKELKEKITQVKLTKDMTVYAKWIAKIPPVVTEEFTITIDPNGGNWNGDTKAKVMKIKKGDYITLPQAPSKKGYTFLYWKGSSYKPGDKYKVEKDHTFVAQWKKNEIKINTNNNSKTKAKNSPKTGVNSIAFVSLTLIIISSLGLFVIGKKQKTNK